MSEKVRLDNLVVEKGFAPSREKAKALIMAGQIYVDNQKCDKAGMTVDPQKVKVELRGEGLRYVSRGGLKLEKAIQTWKIDLADKVCMDIGASTGGFTDCMLQNGARKVYAVDVGYGQFAWKLRNDERVVNMERTNIRYVTPEKIGEPLDFASVDVSFISLRLVLPAAYALLKSGGEMAVLIKPQFEVGREQVGKKGVVKDESVHFSVVRTIADFAQDNGFSVTGLSYSPIKGPEGNIEYLAYLKKDSEKREITDGEIEELVKKSHSRL